MTPVVVHNGRVNDFPEKLHLRHPIAKLSPARFLHDLWHEATICSTSRKLYYLHDFPHDLWHEPQLLFAAPGPIVVVVTKTFIIVVKRKQEKTSLARPN